MNISRRELLKNIAKTALILPTIGFVKACEKKAGPVSSNTENIEPCIHETALTHEQITTRAHLRYVDKTPIPTRTCDNCKVYINPEKNKSCGGCQVLTGPIHPKGWCMSWVARM